jgi:demethylmenaquinone methyltransferase/2-methoxy-6-polyprenyl-1,4-benzoquinol methylase
MCRLPITDSSIDYVTGSYALRNAPELKSCLKEVYRVLKPNGKAYFLDFSQHTNPVLKIVQQVILTLWGSFLGIVFHRNPAVYGYIAKSLKTFPNRQQLRELLIENGLNVTREKFFFFGFISTLETTKRIEDRSQRLEY